MEDAKEVVTRTGPMYFKFAEDETILGDSHKSPTKLGWVPGITTEDLAKEMLDFDLDADKKEAFLTKKGHQFLSPTENLVNPNKLSG